MKSLLKIFGVALLLVVVIGIVLLLDRPEFSASTQSTDDAYVRADFTLVAPRVAGVIDQVLVEEHQDIRAGEVLAIIDDRDFVIAVHNAEAQMSSARAAVAGVEARLVQQEVLIRQARATMDADAAALDLARRNEERYRNLAADGSSSIQAFQQAEAQLQIQSANLEKSRGGVKLAEQQTDVLKADLEKARSAVAQAEAGLAAAELKLSYTRIIAPIAGTIGQKSLRVGGFVEAGRPLLAIVPLDRAYIEAGYRETQLARVRVGQSVDIVVDALPGISLSGTVTSLGPASGVSYSAVAPHNATGNFTKIVQRLPVHIRIDPEQPDARNLRVGMSVTPTIHVK